MRAQAELAATTERLAEAARRGPDPDAVHARLGALKLLVGDIVADVENGLPALADGGPGLAGRAARHLVGAGGKRVRPLLVILSARAAGVAADDAETRASLIKLAQSPYFGRMVLNENGQWTWEPFWKENWELVDKYNELVKRWNRNVAAFAGLQDVGRPLAASDAQVAAVTKLHKQGKSLRAIVDETSLSFRTVRTIVERNQGTDRATKARRQKIERIGIDKFQRAHWRRQKRDGDALPKRVADVIETGKALVTEAKGLGGAR